MFKRVKEIIIKRIKPRRKNLLAVGVTNSTHFLARTIALSSVFDETYIWGKLDGVSLTPYWSKRLSVIKKFSNNSFSNNKIFKVLSAFRKLMRLIFLRFDVLFLHGGFVDSKILFLHKVINFLGGKTIVHIMGFEVLDGQVDKNNPDIIKSLKKMKSLLSNSKLVIAKNDLLYEAIKSKANQANVEIFNWGVDDTVFFPDIVNRSRDRCFTFFSPRGMASLYRIHLIVKAFTMLSKMLEGIELKLILTTYLADTAYLKSITSLIDRELMQDKIEFLEVLSPLEMAKRYRSSNVTVMFPISDGLPQSLLESLFTGTPVITPNRKPYTDWIKNEVVGQKVNGESDEDLAMAMYRAYLILSQLEYATIVKECRAAVDDYPTLSDAGNRLMDKLNY